MTRYWGIRTSKERHDLIGEHLASGVLRQGWGSQDLREIGALVQSGRANDEQRSVWRYTRRMLEIESGDVVLTPHQPEWHRNGVWRVVSGYEFDPLPNVRGPAPDFGHLLRVEPLGVIDHRSAAVLAGLRRALTSGFRTRMRQLDDHGEEIERLLSDPAAARPSDAAEHFAQVRRRARDALGESLLEQYKDADFEDPVRALLEALYPDAVRHTAGRSEAGRDFLIEDTDALGLSRRLIVQVKAWSGTVAPDLLDHGLAQLARGIDEEDHEVDLAVLLTLAEELPADAEERIALAQDQTAVRTRVLVRDETLDLLLDQLTHMKL